MEKGKKNYLKQKKKWRKLWRAMILLLLIQLLYKLDFCMVEEGCYYRQRQLVLKSEVSFFQSGCQPKLENIPINILARIVTEKMYSNRSSQVICTQENETSSVNVECVAMVKCRRNNKCPINKTEKVCNNKKK